MSDNTHIVCPHCQSINRVPKQKLDNRPNCGRCQRPLFTGEAIELTTETLPRHLEKNDIPLLVDGFVATAAVAPLGKLHPEGLAHAMAGHVSAEAAHRRLLDALHMPPLLDLGMRLGEASGAAVAINVVRAALACFDGMATFADAGVSQ